jgi:hypothetical protein
MENGNGRIFDRMRDSFRVDSQDAHHDISPHPFEWLNDINNSIEVTVKVKDS